MEARTRMVESKPSDGFSRPRRNTNLDRVASLANRVEHARRASRSRHLISGRTPVCYLVGVGIDRQPTRTRPVRAVSTERVLG